ncbi:MAG: ABC-2 family transporter protein [Opitutaceae bacterium]|nr:ABC-2 family transporter protein [Opitutaceae bacterium]
MPSLAKYRHAFAVGLQSNLVYRWNFAIRGTFSLFHLVVVFLLWSAAYAGRDTVGGFTLAETMTYFITTLVVQFFIGAFSEDYQISEEIRNGLINQFLTKPINYFLYRLSIFISARLVSGALVLLPLALAMPLLWEFLAIPQGTWLLWHAIPALVMAAMIQFTIAYCFGLLTFWFLEIQSFVILSFAIETLFAGQVFPLDLLPASVYQAVQYLPYPYQMYFPVALLTGRITDPDAAMQGLAIQAFWVVALVVIAQLLWSRGLRRHTAVGG